MADEKIILEVDIESNVGETLNSVKGIKAEIKSLQNEFLNAGDAIEKARIGEKIGQLKDQLVDANEQAAIFTSGSKYEQVNNAFSQMKNNLMSMDFEGAAEKAKSLSLAAKGISFKDAIGSLKSLGSTFITLGKTLLTNPIFLLATIIAAIGIAVYKVLDSLGIIDKAFKAVGDAVKVLWEWIKKAIDIMAKFNPAAWVVNYLIKLGEKAAAEKKALEDQRKLADDRIKLLQKEKDTVSDKYDLEIAKLRAAGKDTFEAEKAKRQAIMDTLKAMNDSLRVLVQSGKATEDQIKQWNAQNAEIKKIKGEMEVAEIAQNKKLADDAKKSAEEKAKAAKEAAEKRKQYEQDRFDFLRRLKDLELSAIQDDLERELAQNAEKYRRLIEDTLKDEKLLADEKKKLVEAFEREKLATEKAIRDKDAAEKKAEQDRIDAVNLKRVDDFNKQKTQMSLDQMDNQFEAERLKLDMKYNEELAQYQKLLDDKLISEAQFNEQKALLDADRKTKTDEINKTEGQAAVDEKVREIEKKTALAKEYTDSAANLIGDLFTIADTFGKKDEKSQKERAKKKFKVDKALAMVNAGIDIGSGIAKTIATMGMPAAIPFVALAGALGAAQLATIASKKFDPDSGGSGGGSAPSTSSGGGATPGGGANTGTQLTAPEFFNLGNRQQTQSSSSASTQKVVVVESDITNTQKKIDVIESRSQYS